MNSTVSKFLQVIASATTNGLGFLVGIPGLILSALVSFFLFICSLFNSSFISDSFSSLFSQATQVLTQVVQFCSYNGEGDFASCIKYIVAFDSLIGDLVICLSATFGVLSLVFFGFVISVLGLLATLYIVRGIQKIISLLTAGYVKT